MRKVRREYYLFGGALTLEPGELSSLHEMKTLLDKCELEDVIYVYNMLVLNALQLDKDGEGHITGPPSLLALKSVEGMLTDDQYPYKIGVEPQVGSLLENSADWSELFDFHFFEKNVKWQKIRDLLHEGLPRKDNDTDKEYNPISWLYKYLSERSPRAAESNGD